MDVDNIINTVLNDLLDIEHNTNILFEMLKTNGDDSQIRYAAHVHETTLKVKEDLLQMQYAIKNVLDTNFKLKNALRQIQDEIDDFED